MAKKKKKAKKKSGRKNNMPDVFVDEVAYDFIIKAKNYKKHYDGTIKITKAGKISRGDIMKALWAHIKHHDLQNPKNKREIFLDDSLLLLFDIPEPKKKTRSNPGKKKKVTMFELAKLAQVFIID